MAVRSSTHIRQFSKPELLLVWMPAVLYLRAAAVRFQGHKPVPGTSQAHSQHGSTPWHGTPCTGAELRSAAPSSPGEKAEDLLTPLTSFQVRTKRKANPRGWRVPLLPPFLLCCALGSGSEGLGFPRQARRAPCAESARGQAGRSQECELSTRRPDGRQQPAPLNRPLRGICMCVPPTSPGREMGLIRTRSLPLCIPAPAAKPLGAREIPASLPIRESYLDALLAATARRCSDCTSGTARKVSRGDRWAAVLLCIRFVLLSGCT